MDNNCSTSHLLLHNVQNHSSSATYDACMSILTQILWYHLLQLSQQIIGMLSSFGDRHKQNNSIFSLTSLYFPRTFLVRSNGKLVNLLSSKHFNKCSLIFTTIQEEDIGSLPWAKSVANAIANNPQSLPLGCLWVLTSLNVGKSVLGFQNLQIS